MRLGYDTGNEHEQTYEYSFNEAEAHAPRIHCLNCGVTLLVLASMRPRRMRLGYVSGAGVCEALLGLASMRPRRMRLGYNAAWCSRQKLKRQLQ